MQSEKCLRILNCQLQNALVLLLIYFSTYSSGSDDLLDAPDACRALFSTSRVGIEGENAQISVDQDCSI
jgi:hypothetical protein